MKLFLATCLLAVWQLRGTAAVGCESSPCEQVCVDTSESYYCACYKNFYPAGDGVSCRNYKHQGMDGYYMGCFGDNNTFPDMDHQIWTRTDATIPECIRSCTSRSFKYAALKGGDQCWCDSIPQRRENQTDTCNIPCTGTASEICGGTEALSLYAAPFDHRYMGCWYEDLDSREMDIYVYPKVQNRPPRDCIDNCNQLGYYYAALFNGGDCYCGDSYQANGEATEFMCAVPCSGGFFGANCGGNTSNAIYRTISLLRDDAASSPIDLVETMWTYPHFQGILTDRVMIHASSVINMPWEDTNCFQQSCYEEVCGTIPEDMPGVYTGNQTDMVVRKFHVRLTDIPGFVVDRDVVPGRMHLFTQTLVIDGSVNLPFSIYIRARQIFIDYSKTVELGFSSSSPVLDIDKTIAQIYGPPSDLTFQKLSMACARMLLGSTAPENTQLALNMVDDLIKDSGYSSEQNHYLTHVRTFRANFTGIGASNLHFVPYYTRAFYNEELQDYHAKVEEYVAEYNALVQDFEDCNKTARHAEILIQIWEDTILERYRVMREDALLSLQVAEETYRQMHANYNESEAALGEAQKEFEDGIRRERRQSVIRAMFHFTDAVFKMSNGSEEVDSGGLADEINEAGSIKASKQNLDILMEELGETMQELEAFLIVVDEIIATEDYDRYMDNVESVAALYPMIIEWDNFKYEVELIFSDPTFGGIDGAQGYEVAIIELCNWGQGLTRTVTEYANLIREYAKWDSLYKTHEELIARFKAQLELMKQNCEEKWKMAEMFQEQNYDVMEIVNDLLFQFCEAYFFELLEVCGPDVRPTFDAYPEALVERLENAMDAAEAVPPRSSLQQPIVITDPADTPDDCVDWTKCPVKVFRETGRFVYTIDLDEGRLQALDKILINELEIQFPGAEAIDPLETIVRLLVSKEGPFMNRKEEQSYSFYTAGVNDKPYGYDIVEEETTVHCDLLDGPTELMIQQAAPFATWNILLDPEYDLNKNIDFSKVEQVTFNIIGSFENTLDRKEERPKYHA